MAAIDRIVELEELLRRLPTAQRATLLKGITDLFIEGAKSYKPSQIGLFDRIFNQLIEGANNDEVAALARRLAPIANAPFEIICKLAQSDDINIAEPVIMRSPCVQEHILLDIAKTKGQTHLLALACRSQLAESIVDVVIIRGDDIVVRYLANNRGVQISERSAAALVERARTDDALADLVSKRTDIPAQMRKTTTSAKTTAAA